GGTVLPRELTARLALTPVDVFFDSDPWTREIFAFGESVQGRLEADIARSVVDLDKDPSLRPPKVKDGVVRLVTRYNKEIWREDSPPTLEDINRLVDRYHRQYHDILERVASRGGVHLGIDCHSMAPIGAPLDPDPGSLRPIFCLGNLGDEEAKGENISCPTAVILKLAKVIEEDFADVELKPGQKLVTLNNPYSGGYILKHHGCKSEGKSTPWLQITINRSLVLNKEPEDPAKAEDVPDSDREVVSKLRVRLLNMLKKFSDRLN
ncbi:N-formylglutamate amidohydrolase, partial [bacterium]|nr:N-formylglutamate amidohydrolase [bacterium]